MSELDRAFWRIIFESWTWLQIESLAQYARQCETSLTWSNAHD